MKIEEIFEICKEFGIHSPMDGVFEFSLGEGKPSLKILPILSWYHPSFANDKLKDESLVNIQYQRGWLDFRTTNWGEENYFSISNYFLEKSREIIGPIINRENETIITVSHFLPRFELLPKVSIKMKPTIGMVVGCKELDELIREYGATIHACGHTHIDHDREIEGIRYVQHALGHPGERGSWWKSDAPYNPKHIFSL